jgi:hypothetical protein
MRLGSSVENLTNFIGINPCIGCKRRKEFMDGLSWAAWRQIYPRNRKTKSVGRPSLSEGIGGNMDEQRLYDGNDHIEVSS